ncbi:unnamed protein product [Rotaria sp. Silwood1]|nr:unnamed protein product [Rotaria sp. Silwood1]CAF1310572.1 unnamed protein product [Rotaria sp. Silwood1]CAF3519342.1 unnamed protein product [Rotaria sp. Silwood1]CAF3760755.1 unnamed protein product [Rotaria sp. Silwood1]CAF4757284.1 unnamed protein product [Rotaria sp. Silwood1]
MEQTNIDKPCGKTLLTLGVANTEQKENLNDQSSSCNDEAKAFTQDKKIIAVDRIETNVIIDLSGENDIPILSNIINDHDYDMATVDQAIVTSQVPAKLREKKYGRYLPTWEQPPESFYKTYTFDIFNNRHEKHICWLYNKKDKNGNDGLGCKLCEKSQKRTNSNGKINLWCTSGYQIMKLSKIMEHKDNEVHKQAQQLELQSASHSQPSWITTQMKERTKQEIAIQNLILSAVYICQQDQKINSLEKLRTLIEALGVKLLPADLGGVTYRNDEAALEFLPHVASYLHEEILEKVKQSQAIVLGLDDDGSVSNRVNCIKSLWRKDDLNSEKTCWFATDNAATFTGIKPLFKKKSTLTVVGVNNGVVAKLKRDYDLDFVELNTCIAHSFALVGKQAGFIKDDDHEKAKKRDLIAKLESIIGRIYQYFGSSATRTFKLKCWQNLLDIPELKFKKLFSIRWTAIRDSIKPIMFNITPTNQDLLPTLQEIKFGKNLTNDDHETAADLLSSILNDDFLFMLHFHYDLHECILGELTKLLQNDDLSYLTLMNVLNEKRQILNNWLSRKQESKCILGPSLNDYLDSTMNNNSYGAFQIVIGDRDKLYKECFTHIDRLLLELDRRFKPSKLQQCFLVLFEPDYLINNKDDVMKSNYGRQELEYICTKYRNLSGFNMNKCRNEWETLKISLSDFVRIKEQQKSRRIFWKSFISWKEAINDSFHEQYKNILILLSIYLISPLNSAEYERGYSIVNRIQTNGRSQIMIDTLDVIMNIPYNTWSGQDERRRINRTQLIIDAPDDYVPSKQIRPNTRKRQFTTIDNCPVKPK